MSSNPGLILRTRRLLLVATTLEHIEAELESYQLLGALLGASVPSSWPPGQYDRSAMQYFRAQLQAHGPTHVGWYGWYAMVPGDEDARASLVAGAGYFGPPSAGSLEIGYSVIPEARNRGYATELVTALVARAFDQPEVASVGAHTSDVNLASTRVLLRCGFNRVGPGREPETIKYQIARSQVKAISA